MLYFDSKSDALKLRAGDLVEIKTEKEILASLDDNGRLEMLPFMPEMLKYCGKSFRVFKRADKTCDTIEGTGLRRMKKTVHLEGLRCDGHSHGGCQAGCLLFWKEAWLKRVTKTSERNEDTRAKDNLCELTKEGSCIKNSLFKATCANADTAASEGETYSCQATELIRATSPLSEWDIRQYFRDLKSGNVGLVEFSRSISVMTYNFTVRAVLGATGSISRGIACMIAIIIGSHFADPELIVAGGTAVSGRGINHPCHSSRLARVVAGLKSALKSSLVFLVEYPHMEGKLNRTPKELLNLRPGETVQVKSKREILQTLDIHCSNRGLTFNREMLPYCGGKFEVLKRVEKIINEKTGKMMHLSNDCIILDKVVCRAYYHKFCPRSIYPYWREIWLRRVTPCQNTLEPKALLASAEACHSEVAAISNAD